MELLSQLVDFQLWHRHQLFFVFFFEAVTKLHGQEWRGQDKMLFVGGAETGPVSPLSLSWWIGSVWRTRLILRSLK